MCLILTPKFFIAKLGSCQKNSLNGDQITIKGQLGGMITSPGFLLKEATGVNRVNCMWTIEAPQGQQIKVQIRRVSLNYGYLCSDKYILIGNGVTVTDNASALVKLCRSNSYSVMSSGQSLTLQYKHICDRYSCSSTITGMYVVFEAVNPKSKCSHYFRINKWCQVCASNTCERGWSNPWCYKNSTLLVSVPLFQ